MPHQGIGESDVSDDDQELTNHMVSDNEATAPSRIVDAEIRLFNLPPADGSGEAAPAGGAPEVAPPRHQG